MNKKVLAGGAAVDPHANGGQYYGPGGFREMRGYPVEVQSNGASHNPADAQKLWQVSEQLTGVHYNFDLDKVGTDDSIPS